MSQDQHSETQRPGLLDVLNIAAQAGYGLELFNVRNSCTAGRNDADFWSVITNIKFGARQQSHVSLAVIKGDENLVRLTWLLGCVNKRDLEQRAVWPFSRPVFEDGAPTFGSFPMPEVAEGEPGMADSYYNFIGPAFLHPLSLRELADDRRLEGGDDYYNTYLQSQEYRGKEQYTLLQIAAKLGHVQTAKLLIDRGADINAVHKWVGTPLHLACGYGHLDMVNLLIERGADVNAVNCEGDGATPLHVAAGCGHSSIVNALIAAGASVDAQRAFGETALIMACKGGRYDVITALLQHGVPPIAPPDAWVDPPIVIVAAKGHTATMQLLRQSGADVNDRRDANSRTALMVACEESTPAAVKFLIEAGADVGVTSPDGSLLHLACKRPNHRDGTVEIAKALLEAGADVNAARLSDLNTPLHLACVRKTRLQYEDLEDCPVTVELVRLLIAAGADVNATTQRGRSPLQIAVYAKHPTVQQLLKEAGAH